MSAFDDNSVPGCFYRECLLPLIKRDFEIAEEVRGILRQEFSGAAVREFTDAGLKRFNGRVLTVLRFHGVLNARGERIAA